MYCILLIIFVYLANIRNNIIANIRSDQNYFEIFNTAHNTTFAFYSFNSKYSLFSLYCI